jgi:hypothetical protein
MLIRVHPTKLIVGETTYIVQICGQERPDGTWVGWLEFHSDDATRPAMRSSHVERVTIACDRRHTFLFAFCAMMISFK